MHNGDLKVGFVPMIASVIRSGNFCSARHADKADQGSAEEPNGGRDGYRRNSQFGGEILGCVRPILGVFRAEAKLDPEPTFFAGAFIQRAEGGQV